MIWRLEQDVRDGVMIAMFRFTTTPQLVVGDQGYDLQQFSRRALFHAELPDLRPTPDAGER